MSWITQTAETIQFTSPSGAEFTAYWKSNERSFEKKIGMYDAPNVKGTITQDLDVKSVMYPLTVYFTGADHLTEADSFFEALQEKGVWTVVHPVKGKLKLQLISAKENIDPVGSGNLSVFDLSWLEPAILSSLDSAMELKELTLQSVLDTIDDGISQLKQLRADAYSAVMGAINMVNKISGYVTSAMSELVATEALVKDAWDAAVDSLSNALDAFSVSPSDSDAQADLADAMIDVIAIPLQANDDYITRFSQYSDLSDSLATLVPTGCTEDDYNKMLFLEFAIIGILISACRIVATSTFTTRTEIVSAMDNITIIFNSCLNTLEDVQSQFENSDIDMQYFSASSCYTSLQKTFSLTMQYLIKQFFNLKSEKRFTLKNDRSPIEITISEYGESNFDDNYDLFLKSNNLTNTDILYLGAGKEVVVYV